MNPVTSYIKNIIAKIKNLNLDWNCTFCFNWSSFL